MELKGLERAVTGKVWELREQVCNFCWNGRLKPGSSQGRFDQTTCSRKRPLIGLGTPATPATTTLSRGEGPCSPTMADG